MDFHSVLPNGRTLDRVSPNGKIRLLDQLQLGHPVDMVAHPTLAVAYVADARFKGGDDSVRCSLTSRRRGVHVIDVQSAAELQGPNGTTDAARVPLPCPPKSLVDSPYVCPPAESEDSENEMQDAGRPRIVEDPAVCPPNAAGIRAILPSDGAFGLAITKHGDWLYASTGISGYVLQFPIDELGRLKSGRAVQVGGFTAGLALAPDESTLFVVRFLGRDGKLESSVAEIGLAPSVDELAQLDSGVTPTSADATRFELLDSELTLSGFGAYDCVAIKEGEHGVRLWVSGFRAGKVQTAARSNPGSPFGELKQMDVGKNPEGLAAYGSDVVVAVSDADKLAVLHYDPAQGIKESARIPVGTYAEGPGASPSQLIIDQSAELPNAATHGEPGYAYAYVTLSTDDALSVVDLRTQREIGALPVGINPSAVAMIKTDGRRRFVVANGKTPYGPQLPVTPPWDAGLAPARDLDACWVEGDPAASRIGRNDCIDGKFPPRPDIDQYNNYDTSRDEGALSLIDDADTSLDAPGLKTFAENDGKQAAALHVTEPVGKFDPGCEPGSLFPIPLPVSGSQLTPIQHVFLVVRENKTYDFLLGDLQDDQNRRGEPLYAVDHIRKLHGWPPITPNLHALARRFTSLDNFYADAEVSTQGHSWATSSFVNDYLERIHLEEDSSRAFFGFAFDQEAGFGGAEPGFGSFFEHLLRQGVSFKVYGEAVGLLGHVGDDFVANHANVGAPFLVQDKEHSDIPKVEHLADELRKSSNWPAFTYILLPRDHTLGTDPGKPSPVSMIADNDVATGKLIEAISHIGWLWESSAIFIVEDDSMQGYDHIDYHRSICVVVSPWARPGHNSPVHASYPALFHTIETILGIDPLNRFDRYAPILWDAFVANPEPSAFRPFQAECNRVPLDAINPTECKPTATAPSEPRLGDDEFDHRPDVDRAVWDLVTGSELGIPAPR